jgi:hypothetical protein
MRMCQRLILCAVALAAIVCSVGPAAAIRPSCSELLSIRAGGKSDEEIVRTYGTTRARLAACDRLAAQSERFAAERTQFFQQRDERGLDH